MQTTVVDLVADILREIRVVNAIDPVASQDADFVLRKMNRLLDLWNAKRQATFSIQRITGTFTPSLSPHTIGPTGTFVTSSRPVSIEENGVYWTQNGIDFQIQIQPMSWWDMQGQKGLSTSFPTDVAYNPVWPNGELYFWPVPNVAQTITLVVRTVLGALVDTDTLDVPPGYTEAIVLTTAENCIGSFGVEVPSLLRERALEARGIAFSNNEPSEPLATSDYGTGSRGGWFDYRSGRVR